MKRNGRLSPRYVDRTDLRQYATGKPLAREPVYRWFLFPHSFSADLVRAIIRFWDLKPRDRILDPFVGAGTTLLVAKENGISAIGLDISPLSVFVTRVKLADLDAEELVRCWQHLNRFLPLKPPIGREPETHILRRAFHEEAFDWWSFLRRRIDLLVPPPKRQFFVLALLRAMRGVCRGSSDGGWLRWTSRRPNPGLVPRLWHEELEMMISDARLTQLAKGRGLWTALQADARFPPSDLGQFSAIICSPPYPNRHDYTRVFAPELLLEFLDYKGLKSLRYGSFRSHVEAKAPAYSKDGYRPSKRLHSQLAELEAAPITDRRVIPMIEGYFRDTFQLLRGIRRHLRPGARLAFVVGNVRHAGVMIEADQNIADMAKRLGYKWESTWVIRYRGNSAQQMATFGREAARESVVFLRSS